MLALQLGTNGSGVLDFISQIRIATVTVEFAAAGFKERKKAAKMNEPKGPRTSLLGCLFGKRGSYDVTDPVPEEPKPAVSSKPRQK